MTKEEKIAREMSEAVNDFTFNHDKFVEHMSREHRTLQQTFTRLCLKWIKFVASDEYRYDGRNEVAHFVCKDLVKGHGEHFHDLPLI